MDYDVRIISTLEKVLPKSGMLDARPIRKLTGFRKTYRSCSRMRNR